MSVPPPDPTSPADSRAEVLLGYLAYFRSTVAAKLDGLPEAELRASRLPSGWSPLELLTHLTHMERRWLVWGFEGEDVGDPWGDRRDDRWHVPADVTLTDLLDRSAEQAARTEAVVRARSLEDVGAPSDRWAGADPPTLERVLLHVLQEYARHVGHLDVVREMIDGWTSPT